MSGVNKCSDAEMTSASEIRFIVGRDHQGQWVVEDRLGLLGGFFVSESAALHFALHEADHNSALVYVAPDDKIVEFCFTKQAFERATTRNAA
jgi:hypothetical protein